MLCYQMKVKLQNYSLQNQFQNENKVNCPVDSNVVLIVYQKAQSNTYTLWRAKTVIVEVDVRTSQTVPKIYQKGFVILFSNKISS